MTLAIVEGRPYKPKNCTIYEGDSGYAEVLCTPNLRGGLKVRYNLEVFDDMRRRKFRNYTNPVTPHFILRGLSPRRTYRIEVFADNRRGRSDRFDFNIDLRSVLKNIGESSSGRSNSK